ncbi:MAG: hypothetical protein ACXVXC_13420 [Nocardioidaceae bacterium]
MRTEMNANRTIRDHADHVWATIKTRQGLVPVDPYTFTPALRSRERGVLMRSNTGRRVCTVIIGDTYTQARARCR